MMMSEQPVRVALPQATSIIEAGLEDKLRRSSGGNGKSGGSGSSKRHSSGGRRRRSTREGDNPDSLNPTKLINDDRVYYRSVDNHNINSNQNGSVNCNGNHTNNKLNPTLPFAGSHLPYQQQQQQQQHPNSSHFYLAQPQFHFQSPLAYHPNGGGQNLPPSLQPLPCSPLQITPPVMTQNGHPLSSFQAPSNPSDQPMMNQIQMPYLFSIPLNYDGSQSQQMPMQLPMQLPVPMPYQVPNMHLPMYIRVPRPSIQSGGLEVNPDSGCDNLKQNFSPRTGGGNGSNGICPNTALNIPLMYPPQLGPMMYDPIHAFMMANLSGSFQPHQMINITHHQSHSVSQDYPPQPQQSSPPQVREQQTSPPSKQQ